MGVGDNIRQLRRSAKLTQKELGDLVDVSDSHIGNIETGTANPRLIVLERIAEAFGITVNELMQDSKPKNAIAHLKIQRDNKMGKRLRSIRESRHMTRQKLSEASGYWQGGIRDIEEGRTKPTAETIEKLAKALQVPVEVLSGADNTAATRQQELAIKEDEHNDEASKPTPEFVQMMAPFWRKQEVISEVMGDRIERTEVLKLLVDRLSQPDVSVAKIRAIVAMFDA